MRLRCQKEEPKNSPFTREQILEMNRAHDRKRNERPSWLVPVPTGFSKSLDDDELDQIVGPYHRNLEEQSRTNQILKELEESAKCLATHTADQSKQEPPGHTKNQA